MEPRIIHLHVSKTAGTSLHEILSRQYGAAAVHKVGETDPNGRWSPVGPDLTRAIQQSGIRVFSGHMAFGLHEHIPGPCLYVTMLRHPIDRIASYYDWVLRHPGSFIGRKLFGKPKPLIGRRLSRKPSFDEFLENGQVRALVENGQTRLIGRQLLAWTGPIDRQTLESAKRNLDAFTVAGLVDRFDESVDLMQRLLGWTARTTTPTLNVTPERREPPADALTTLLQRNRLDLELYEFAAERFSSLWDRHAREAVKPDG